MEEAMEGELPLPAHGVPKVSLANKALRGRGWEWEERVSDKGSNCPDLPLVLVLLSADEKTASEKLGPNGRLVAGPGPAPQPPTW